MPLMSSLFPYTTLFRSGLRGLEECRPHALPDRLTWSPRRLLERRLVRPASRRRGADHRAERTAGRTRNPAPSLARAPLLALPGDHGPLQEDEDQQDRAGAEDRKSVGKGKAWTG